MASQPLAFLSYVHDDDLLGEISAFRERLASEVAALTGREFPIFQDRRDIHWGDAWQARIKGSLEAVTFLIPFVTPRFFNSSYCREELEQYLQRAQASRDLALLPVYYIDSELINDDEAKKGQPIGGSHSQIPVCRLPRSAGRVERSSCVQTPQPIRCASS